MQSWTHKIGPLFLLLMVLCFVGLAGCGDDDKTNNGIGQANSGLLSVQPLSVSFSQIALDESDTRQVVVKNAHATDGLTIHSIKLRAREGASAADLRLLDLPSEGVRLAPEETKTFTVEYTARGQENSGIIEIRSSDPTYTNDRPYELNVTTVPNRPELVAEPSRVRFPTLPPGETAESVLTIRNYGSAPLIIEEALYSGGSDFAIDGFEGDQVVLDPYDSAQAQVNSEPYELEIPVYYTPQQDGGDSGEIILISNDVRGQTNDDGQGVHIIDVQANADAPCILVNGTTRRFGPVPIGAEVTDIVRVTNCGTKPLDIDAVEMTENSDDDEFILDLGSWDANADGVLDEIITIEPGEDDSFRVDYGPTQVGSDTGNLVIKSNDPAQRELDVELRGRGSDGQCPEAKITAKVRGQNTAPRTTITAAPLDYILLDGSTSEDPDGRVDRYEFFTLEAPDGVRPNVTPLEDGSRAEFRALTAGTYKMGVVVYDNEGFRSCNEAVATIVATPNEKIHIELTWTNPQDPDESDDTGSDVDLHLVKMGPGQWFESPYDIYFRNPNSGADDTGIWQPESPSLDIDDTDGAGPENIQMDDPSNCEWYAVGIHYYRQLYGTAYATVRIYVNGDPVFEELNKPLQRGGQFWDVARVHWNQGQATVLGVGDVRPAAPLSEEPEVTASMSETHDNGDPKYCTTRGLY